MNNESLAQKIAELLEAERPSAELSGIQASLDAISARLEKLESVQMAPRPVVGVVRSAHPSTDKFAIAEAIADQIFAAKGEEKACTFEPNGKPCDHCSMCSSRGF
jgi:hypothetical protein